ncbi:hypothetical protein [Pseudoduganella ginsengisoli]|uniref:Uncharacterized protein n=1 Tax=Pseudoduganella ginsengisoli TaxID=1462440 RepID=A0A6L6Q6N1_9BURK|nr:hypothetical protein [Pseudoduganella ginsengisoli]MTW04931.1 hypothetical protein [Pseudoduganella ginsengisoli]
MAKKSSFCQQKHLFSDRPQHRPATIFWAHSIPCCWATTHSAASHAAVKGFHFDDQEWLKFDNYCQITPQLDRLSWQPGHSDIGRIDALRHYEVVNIIRQLLAFSAYPFATFEFCIFIDTAGRSKSGRVHHVHNSCKKMMCLSQVCL